MSKRKLIIIGVVCYLLFSLVLTPASWWLKLAPIPAELQLGKVDGTLWQGDIAALRYRQLQLTDVRWTFKPLALFSGKLQFNVNSGSLQDATAPYISALASYGFGGAALSDTLVKMPVAQLVPLLPLPLPVAASGELVLDIAEFSQGQPRCSTLGGNSSWQNARLQTPTGTWLELQSLFGQLRCDNGTLVLETDGANVLGLQVKAVVNAEQILVNGTVKPDASMPQEVHQAMQFLGKPDAQGRYPIRF